MTSSLPTPSVVCTAQELHGRWGVSTIATAAAAVLEYSCPLALQGHDCLVAPLPAHLPQNASSCFAVHSAERSAHLEALGPRLRERLGELCTSCSADLVAARSHSPRTPVGEAQRLHHHHRRRCRTRQKSDEN